MTQRSRLKTKGRRDTWTFAKLPHHVLESREYAKLNGSAVKLLIDLLGQFRGQNNGDFTLAWRVMSKRGWRSRDTLNRARTELLESGWITLTRQGGRHRCGLYAVTWLVIDGCNGKLDVAPTRVASNTWRKPTSEKAALCTPPVRLAM